MHDRVIMVIHFEPSVFRLYHLKTLKPSVYKVSGSIFAAPVFETVKGHEPSGPDQAPSADATHQWETRNYGRVT